MPVAIRSGGSVAATAAVRDGITKPTQTTGRQLGSALSFAILIAVLGTPHNAADFRDAWAFMLVASLLAGVSLAAVGARGAARALEPVRALSVDTGSL